MVPLRLLRPWNGFDPGRELDLDHPGLAEELVRMGIAERRDPPKAAGPPKPKGKPPKPKGKLRGAGAVHS